MQWSTASNKEQTRFFTRRQVGDVTDKVSITMVWEWSVDHFTLQYRPLLIEMLQSNSTVTYRELANRVQERLAEKPPRDILLRLLKVQLLCVLSCNPLVIGHLCTQGYIKVDNQ